MIVRPYIIRLFLSWTFTLWLYVPTLLGYSFRERSHYDCTSPSASNKFVAFFHDPLLNQQIYVRHNQLLLCFTLDRTFCFIVFTLDRTNLLLLWHSFFALERTLWLLFFTLEQDNVITSLRIGEDFHHLCLKGQCDY